MYARAALFALAVLTGLRRRHLLLFVLAVAAGLAGLTAAFWWLGELADGAAGLPGVLAVVVAWAVAAALLVGGSALAGVRIVLRMVARPLWVAAARSRPRSPRTSRS